MAVLLPRQLDRQREALCPGRWRSGSERSFIKFKLGFMLLCFSMPTKEGYVFNAGFVCSSQPVRAMAARAIRLVQGHACFQIRLLPLAGLLGSAAEGRVLGLITQGDSFELTYIIPVVGSNAGPPHSPPPFQPGFSIVPFAEGGFHMLSCSKAPGIASEGPRSDSSEMPS